MAATQAKTGFGTKLYRGDGVTPTEGFSQQVAELLDVDGPELTQNLEDATHMESPGGWEEKIATTRAAGNVTFQMHLLQDDASQNALRADLAAGTKRNYRLVIGQAQTKRWSFSGFVASIGQSAPVKGKMVCPVSMAITGQPVFEVNP